MLWGIAFGDHVYMYAEVDTPSSTIAWLYTLWYAEFRMADIGCG
jgi:hypothetical protein